MKIVYDRIYIVYHPYDQILLIGLCHSAHWALPVAKNIKSSYKWCSNIIHMMKYHAYQIKPWYLNIIHVKSRHDIQISPIWSNIIHTYQNKARYSNCQISPILSMVLLRELISFEESTGWIANKDYHPLVNLLVGGPSDNPKARFYILCVKHIFSFCLVHWYPLRVKYGPRNSCVSKAI